MLEEVCLLLEFDDALKSKIEEKKPQSCTDDCCLQLHHPRACRKECVRAPKARKFWLPGSFDYPTIILADQRLLPRMKAPSLVQTNPKMTGLQLFFAGEKPQQPRGVITPLLEVAGLMQTLQNHTHLLLSLVPQHRSLFAGSLKHQKDRK